MRRRPTLLGDAGASFVSAVMAMVAVLGFGAVALDAIEQHHHSVERTLDADRVALAAEFAASEAAARVMDGEHAAFSGGGTLEGVDYSYSSTPGGSGEWLVIGRAGGGADERTVEVDLRRDEEASEAVEDRYAVFTESLLDIGWVRSGDVDGPVASRDRIRYWYSHSIGTTQDVVTGGSCSNCPDPQTIDSYETLPLPDASGAAACPASGTYRLTGPVELGGHYLCDRAWSTLRISGEISVSEPTVIHVGSNTRIDIRDAVLNPDGNSANLLIVQPTTSDWAYEAVIDDTTMYARILTPNTWWYVGDVAWRGAFEVDSWWLYDWANIDGAWDGGAPVTVTVSWHIDRWQLS